MTGTSVPEAGTPPTRSEALADAVEAELDRLRRARPHLSSRLDRASQILLMQLASPPRQRPIRCSLGQDGGYRRALVKSSTESGGVYVVQGGHYACSCPDFHRSGPGCKHSLSVYILERVAKLQVGHARPRSELGCAHCTNGWVSIGEDLIDSQSGEVAHAENIVRCQRCQTREPPYMSAEELEAWMHSTRWRYASSMPAHPHDYSLREWNDRGTFDRVCRTIWDKGYDRRYIGRRWRSLDIGPDHYVWLHSRPEEHESAPIAITELVNRAVRTQERLV